MRSKQVLLLIFILTSVTFAQNNTKSLEKTKPVKTIFLKKELNFRSRALKTKYALHKKPNSKFKIPSNWKLTFEDQFDSLNTQKWRLGQAWGEIHPQNLHQYYSKEQIKVKNGFLYLGGAYEPKAFKFNDSSITVPYAIGLINSDLSFKQKYGYFEIRAKNPKGAATWPAFWLTGATKWPPEIDIFEMYGRKNGKHVHHQYMSLHWGKDNTKSRGFMSQRVKLPNNTDSVFHQYACLWTPQFIKFYTDGRLVSKIRLNKRLRQWFDDEMVIIINNCFEQKYLSYLPKDFKSNQFIVDWVRVYSFQ